ncbi:MAG: serine/threonine-protein kinase, partial [Planctomycetota bacterium]
MTEAKHCSRCGSRLPDASPIGEACPKCLLAGGLESAGPHELPPTSAASDRWEAPSAEEMDERFVNLEVLEMIGQGGMGAVYRARQSMLGREVAVKVLSPRISNDPAFEKRFAREARALAQLSHPGIVTIYDFGRQDDLCYLVMEFIDGVDLRDAIRAKAIDADKTLEVVSQICDALQYAHAQGVVHRDIKPENILLDRKGRVKLADFGLAKLVGTNDNDASLTATNQVMGTLHYMAPEQLEQPLAVDHRADIYSLGVVFYELLTGQLPLGRFKLPSENDANAAVLDDVVLKTLQRSPDDRYQQVSEVSTDLDRASHANASTDQKDAPSERQLPVESELSRPSIKVISRRADPGLILTGVVIALVGTGLLVHGVSEQRETLWIGVGVAVSAVFLFASAFRSSTAKRVELLSAPNVGVL